MSMERREKVWLSIDVSPARRGIEAEGATRD
jgi:hypothetical protein